MDDREQVIKLYHDMYAAMVSKNESELIRVYDESFELIHMSGMRQSRTEFIQAIMNGMLNYYSEDTHDIEVSVSEDKAVMTGRSRVTAAVFRGGRHTWKLALRFDVKKTGEDWKIIKAQASTW